MSFGAFLYTLFIAVLITVLFSYGMRNKGPWGTTLTFFTILLLAMMSADLWITPFGPHWNDIFWFPPFIWGAITAFILALLTVRAPVPRIRSKELAKEVNRINETRSRNKAVSLKILFWLILALLLILVLVGIYR